MATAGDIREIMDIPQEGHPKPAPKKVKIEHGPKLTGFQREVQSLMNDSHNVPPIPIVESTRYKAKPGYAPRPFKSRKWEQRSFTNGARTDGLVLRHWKHAIPPTPKQTLLRASTNAVNMMPAGQVQAADSEGENLSQSEIAPRRYNDEFPMEKFNITVNVPHYTQEQYDANFKSEDWSKEETDYLLALCRDFGLRWIVVADRYDPDEIPLSAEKAAQIKTESSFTDEQSEGIQGDEMVIDQASAINGLSSMNLEGSNNSSRPPYSQRTAESLKSRYYAIASKMLSINTPPDTMTPSEFTLWEKMKNFDARSEEIRKNTAERLFLRSKEEADEERILLEELARITKYEDEFLKMRKDILIRLETPALGRRHDEQSAAAICQNSATLGQLLNTMLNKEKRRRPGMIDTSRANSSQDPNGEAERGTAGDRPKKQTWEKGQHPNQYTARRNTMESETGPIEVGPKKTGSISKTPNIRPLTRAEETKYGVAHPSERITSGVQFRHEKVTKIIMSKSTAQLAKIQAALIELGIPIRLLMPTERVCRDYETLISEIVLLLDARKAKEKVASEVKVLEESKRLRLGLPKEGEKEGQSDTMDLDSGLPRDEDSFAVSKAGDGDADQDADGDVDADVSMVDQTQITSPPEQEESFVSATQETQEQVTQSRYRDQDVNGDEDAKESGAEDEEEAEDEDEDEEEDPENEDEEKEEYVGDRDDENHSEIEIDMPSTPEGQVDEEDAEAEEEVDEEDGEEDEEAEVDENGEEAEAEAEAEASIPPTPENDNEDEEEEDEEVDGADAANEDGEEEKAQDEAKSPAVTPDSKPPQRTIPSTRLNKRSASVISDTSRAGSNRSNRSGAGRKKGRR